MPFTGILLVFLLGISTMNLVDSKYSLLEYLGGAFPVGMGTATLIMFLINVTGLNITREILFFTIIPLIFLFNYKLFFQPKSIFHGIKKMKERHFFYTGRFNILWLVLLLLIITILVIITIKNLYWPTSASDALSSFDLFAKAIAAEGKILNSLIYDQNVGFGAAYPPLYSLSLSYAFIFGFESSKIIPALFFICFTILFYSLLIQNGSSTGAAMVTFFMILTPELLAQSAINTTSVTQAMYGSTGIIALFTWNKTEQKRYLFLSIILLALNGWTRSEGIIYIGAGFIFLIWKMHQNKKWLKVTGILLIASLPFLIWQIFLKSHAEVMTPFVQANIQLIPNLNGEKISTILEWTKINLFHPVYYGIAIYVFIIGVLFNIFAAIKRKQSLFMLTIILIPLLGYLILINQIHLNADSVEAIMRSSGKRFFFGFIILLWFYISQVYPIRNLFSWLDRYLGVPQKIIE